MLQAMLLVSQIALALLPGGAMRAGMIAALELAAINACLLLGVAQDRRVRLPDQLRLRQ